MSKDLQALHSLREDMHGWTDRRQRFAAAFFPEVGHDPYRELDGHASKSFIERGHALAVLQDAWLGDIMDDLQKSGALDHTIIVVTSDHGARTVRYIENGESFFSTNGKEDDVIMHVPMLIYVPKVLEHPVEIDSPTSHIDIPPTILDLLGIESGRELEEGSVVTSPEIESRRLFLPMDLQFGASEFYDDGFYYMRSSTNMVYKSSTLTFTDGDALPFGSQAAEHVRKLLADQKASQRVLDYHLLHGSAP
jgi:hypothetical protein